MAEQRGMKRARREKDEETSLHKFEEALHLCTAKFGYNTLRNEQRITVLSFFKGNDVFVCLVSPRPFATCGGRVWRHSQ